MKLRILSLFLALAAVGESHLFAGSVTLSSVGAGQFALKDGQILPQGLAVRIGTFVLPEGIPPEALSSTTDYVTLKSWFQPLAESGPASGILAQPGGALGYLRANGFPSAGDLFGTISNISTGYMVPDTQLYVWVSDHADPEEATQWGLFTAEGWTVPEMLGTRVLSIDSTVQALHGSRDGSQLRLRDIPVSYGNWSWKRFTSNALPETSAPAADPDGNGFANLAEYAWKLGTNTRGETRSDLAMAGCALTFTFKRPRDLPDVTVFAECSLDLKKWDLAPAEVISNDDDFDTLRATAPAGERCFWRVRFSSATPAP